MSELLSADFLMRLRSRDVLPSDSQTKSNSSSVYARRYVVQKIANNGSTFLPNSEMRFRLTSTQSGVVPSSLALRFHVSTNAGVGTTQYALDSHPALAVISRFRSFVAGGKAVDDVNYCNNLSHQLLEIDGNKNWVNGSGGVMLGSWKHNPLQFNRDQAQGNATAGATAVVETENSCWNRFPTACQTHEVGAGGTGGIDCVVPLSLLGCSLASQNSILNLRAMGVMEFVITLSSVEKAIAVAMPNLAGGAPVNGVPSFTITQPHLMATMVDFNSDYMRLLDNAVEGSVGIRYPLKCYNVQQQGSVQAPARTRKDYVFSGAYRAVEDLTIWKTHPQVDDIVPVPAVANTPACAFALSTSRNGNQNHFRVNISGRNYPDFDALTNNAQTYWYNQEGLATLNNYTHSTGCNDNSKWRGSAHNITTTAVAGTGGATAPIVMNANQTLRSSFQMLQSFRTARNAKNIDLQGADLSLAGSVIRISVDDNDGSAPIGAPVAGSGSGSNNQALYCAFRHTRLMSLANGELQVEY